MQRVKQFHQALMDAFTPDELDRLLAYAVDRRLEDFTSDKKAKDAMFLDVIDASVAGGWMHKLAHAAFLERSGNEKIRAFHENHIDGVFRDELPRIKREIEKAPYYVPETMDVKDRVRELEIVLRGMDGYNGALSKLRKLEILFMILVTLRVIEMIMISIYFLR